MTELEIAGMTREEYDRVLNGMLLGTVVGIREAIGRYLKPEEVKAIAGKLHELVRFVEAWHVAHREELRHDS